MSENNSPDFLRELGKSYLWGKDTTAEKKNLGIKLILDACSKKDPEASYLVARMILDGVLNVKVGNPTDYALQLLCSCANSGFDPARVFLDRYCEERYDKNMKIASLNDRSGPLVDFDGKPISINRKGVFTPVDAVLEYIDGENILTFTVNVMFSYYDQIQNQSRFESAVCAGLGAWKGEYEVFDGQKLRVDVKLTFENNIFDNLLIIPFTESISSGMNSVGQMMPSDNNKKINDIIENKRSFAMNGLKWSATSRKTIFIQSNDGLFSDYDDIMHVTKHEFGHALGLGDLYSNKSDSLTGVDTGTYAELDSYAISNKLYNLVMCDYHGPISNNDIEMVVLAFKENKMQHYQPSLFKGKISSALGKGN